MAEQGCIIVNSEQASAGLVVVTPATQPVHGEADTRRTVVERVYSKARKVQVSGATLVIGIKGAKVGDMLCWTSYA